MSQTETKEIVPDSSKPVGNTKQPAPALHWCFTWNNYSKDEKVNDCKYLFDKLTQISSKFLFQEETGETGTKHLQGYCHLKVKTRLSGLKKISDKIHWEVCRNIDASIQYCQKGETRTGEIFTYGFAKPVKTIDTLFPWQQHCYDLLKESNDRNIIWIYETIGNVGKTAFCKWLYLNDNIIYITGGKGSDILHVTTEALKAKPNCETFVFDFPRTLEGHVSYNAIEQIKNGFWTSTKYEGGTVCINNPAVVIFANWIPDTSQLSSDRWNIYEIIEECGNLVLLDYNENEKDGI